MFSNVSAFVVPARFYLSSYRPIGCTRGRTRPPTGCSSWCGRRACRARSPTSISGWVCRWP